MRTPQLTKMLAALVAALVACGPGAPPAPEPGPGSGDGGGGDAGDDGGGGETGGGGDGGGSGAGGGQPEPPSTQMTAWLDVIGGRGVELAVDVAAVPGDAVVALNAIGVDGDRLEAIGLVRIDGGGTESWARAFETRGASVRFPANGALAAAPQGHLYVVFACLAGCGGFGDDVSGTALVRLSAGGDPEWIAAVPGALASNVAVDGGGDAVVATVEGGATVVRKYAGDGRPQWAVRPGGAAEVALAADGGGGVVVGAGSAVTKLDAGGRVAWTRDLAAGATVTAVGATSAGDVVATGTAESGGVGGTGVGPGAFVAFLDGGGRVSSARALGSSPPGGLLLAVSSGGIAVVTDAETCAAEVASLAADGAVRWARPVAPAACEGDDLSAHAVDVTTSGAVAVAGALRGPADLGKGVETPSAIDAFVVAVQP